MKQVTAYKCDFCHRVFSRPVNAKQHEDCCKLNPIRCNCRTCINLIDMDVEREGYTGKELCCKLTKTPLYDKPYFIECDEDDFCGYCAPAPMPGTCWNYEYKGEAK